MGKRKMTAAVTFQNMGPTEDAINIESENLAEINQLINFYTMREARYDRTIEFIGPERHNKKYRSIGIIRRNS
jgi:hypothetical protein